MQLQRELDVALTAAREAGQIQKQGINDVKRITSKSDHSPVSEIDTQSEACIREHIQKVFAQDGILGEEGGLHQGSSGRRWVIDPLDGTRPYLRGIPTYSVLIALEDEHHEPVVGVMHLPGLDETYWARKGHGAFCNDTRIHVSSCASLDAAMGTTLGLREYAGTPRGERMISFMRSLDYCYGFMDTYSYACIAAGRMELCVNLMDKTWDCAAPACIIREAGGVCTDIHGRHSHENGSFVAANAALHASALAFFND